MLLSHKGNPCQHSCTNVFKPAFLSFRNVLKIAQVETGGVLLGKLLIWNLIMRSWRVTYSLLVLLWLSHAAVVTGCYLRAQISRYPKNSFFHFEGNEQTLSLTFLIPDAVSYLYDQRVCYVFEPLPCWTKILYIFFSCHLVFVNLCKINIVLLNNDKPR